MNKHAHQLVALEKQDMYCSMASSHQSLKNASTFSNKQGNAVSQEVATNKNVHQQKSLTEQELHDIYHEFPNIATTFLDIKGKAVLQEVNTNQPVQQLKALENQALNSSMGSSRQSPNNASTSSDKQAKHAVYRSNRRLRAALAEVTAKVDHLSKQQETAYEDMTKPIFSSTELEHPLNFLEDLQKYFAKLPMERQTINTVFNCLEGPANDWALIIKNQWTNIEDFNKDFIEHYWGMSSQKALRGMINNGSYSDEKGSMSSYFISIILQAKWLPRKISDDELVSDIMHHFSKQVQIAWYLSKNRTVPEAMEFLRKMDEIEMMCASKEGTQKESQKAKYKLRTRENVLNNTEYSNLDGGQSASKIRKCV